MLTERTRYHRLPLQLEEIRALKAGEPIIAPFHKGSTSPCRGCDSHRADLVAVVVLGAPPIENYGWLRESGLDVINAAITDQELGHIERAEAAPTFTYLMDARIPGGRPVEITLSMVPPEWWAAFCQGKGRPVEWGSRLPAEVLRPSNKVRLADRGA